VRDWRFTTAAVLILGFAVGANTAIFSVASDAAYREMAEYTDIFAATLAASIPVPARYLHEGGVLGHQAWTRMFRADPSVVGRVVRIEGVPISRHDQSNSHRSEHSSVGTMPAPGPHPRSHTDTGASTARSPRQSAPPILAFAERILPRASDLRVQASLDYKQRLQQLFFPEGIAYDGNRFNRTAATASTWRRLRVLMKEWSVRSASAKATAGQPSRGLPTGAHADVDKRERRLVSLTFASWNHVTTLLLRIQALRQAA
jgi:hypothetical protein